MSFKTHPKYPNIIAMSETFNQYGIDAVLVQVPKERLRELPEDFVAVLTIDKVSKTVFVSNKENAPLQTRTIDNKTKVYSDSEFMNLWTGIALGVNQNPNPKVKFTHPFFKLQSIYYAVLFTGLLYGFFALIKNNILSLASLGYLSLAMLAFYLGFSIVKKKLGFNDGLNKLCSTFGKSSCTNIITKDNDHLFLNISFSDLAICYAIFSVTVSFFITQFNLINALFVFTISAVPFLLYSLYVQYFVLKQFCAICLTLISIVFLQILCLGFASGFMIDWDMNGIIFLIFTMGTITSIWMLLKDKLSYFEEIHSSSLDFHQLIREYDMYQAIQEHHEADTLNFDKVQSVVLTDHSNEATNTIHVVLSPTCSGCTAAYKDLKKLMNYHSNHLKIALIFDLRSSSEHVQKVFSRIAEMSVSEQIIEALDDWFIDKKLEKQWLHKWGDDNGIAKEVLNSHQQFLNEERIFQTPMIFFNHSQLSSFYRLKDLVYFMKLA